jgi:hypothetical protein
MTDYTLSDGDDITTMGDTTIENFHYHGGKIRVPSSYNFIKTGEFIFEPETDEDPIGSIYGALVARLSIETGKNGIFAGFQLYDLYPENKALFFPCIVFGKLETAETITQELFGGDAMEGVTVVCDLAFKTNYSQRIGNVLIEKTDLANYYLTRIRDILTDIRFNSDLVNIGNFKEDSSVQEPKEANQTLYGFAMEIKLDFKIHQTT